MKRNFNCSDSLTHFLSHPLEGEMKAEEECIYNGEFQSMVDGDGGGGGEEYGGDETSQFGDKKRRLSNHQVKSLEKIFEVDNKLDPDRKVKVAQDLGLQPRQVAIWFQNRRGRWKTKHLERDYNLLKSNYDTLKQNYHKLEQEKETIIKECTRTLRTTSGEHEFLRFKPHPQYDEDDRKQPQPQQQQHDEAGPSGSHQMSPDWDAYTAFQGLSLRTHYHDVHIQRSLDWQHQSLLGFYARMAPGYEPRPPPTYAVWPPQDPSPPGYDSYEQWRDQFPGPQ